MRKKINVIIILISIFFIIFPYMSLASELEVREEGIKVATELGLGDLNEYGGKGEETLQFKENVNRIVSFIQIIGVVMSVVVLVVLGIKYMMGSVEEKADYKKTMIPYLVGAFMVFSISTIPQIIYKIVENF